MAKLTSLRSWKKLEEHHKATSQFQMRELFKNDPDRFDRFSVKFNDILLDYSKNRITSETMSLLQALAREVELKNSIEMMFSGEKINGHRSLHVNTFFQRRYLDFGRVARV